MSPYKIKKAAAPATRSTRQQKPHMPLRTTVVGSYPFPGWLEFGSAHLEQFGEADIEEMKNDAVIVAVHDQVAAGLDVIPTANKPVTISTCHFTAGSRVFTAPRFLRAASDHRRTISGENTRSRER